MKIRKFSKEFMLDVLYEHEEKICEDRVVDSGRWTENHRFVFEHDGKLYETWYERGLTEIQDVRPWEFEDEVECTEVRLEKKTVVVEDYVPVLDDE